VTLAAEDAAKIVATAVSRRAPKDRPVFLREMAAHIAASLVTIEGSPQRGRGYLPAGRRRGGERIHTHLS
jgi:predicted RNA-binding Zn ribbon-like protein